MQGVSLAVLQQLSTTSQEVQSIRTTANGRAAVKPPLKWAGGKRWLLPYLRPLWERYQHRRLVEPLCGGLAVSLGLRPTRALINDLNPHVINFYHWVKRGLRISLKMKNQSQLYYAYRSRFNKLVEEDKAATQEEAELFYYLNRTGYNGLCRFNRRGEFNVPFGKYAQINYVTDFSPYQSIFARWQFTSLDFEQVEVQPEDFMYADPPYDVEFTQYSKDRFTWDDQVRLAEWLARHPGPVALSSGRLPFARWAKAGMRLVLTALRSMWAPRSKATALHQSFKERFLAPEQRDEWELSSDAIAQWLETPSIRWRLCELAREDGELAEIRRLDEEAKRGDQAWLPPGDLAVRKRQSVPDSRPPCRRRAGRPDIATR